MGNRGQSRFQPRRLFRRRQSEAFLSRDWETAYTLCEEASQSNLTEENKAHIDLQFRRWLTVLTACWFVSAASAATFTVNSTADVVDATPGDGICATAAGTCTLRAAIQESNALPGADTVIVPAGTYTLTIPGRGETAAATGDLDITDSLTVTGAGAATTIVQPCPTFRCSGIDRVFHVDPNGARINVTISGMTIQNGTTLVIPFVSANGGAILLGVAQTQGSPVPSGRLTLTDCVIQVSSTPSDGGGIFNNAGSLTLIRTTVTANSANNGGGIANGDTGTVSLTDSTVSLNAATQGGGIFSGYFDTGISTKVTLTNATISGNTVGSGPGTGFGGGIFANRGSFTITNSTLSGNTSSYAGGGINANITVALNNSTIVGNTAGTSAAGGSGAGFSGSVAASNTIFAGNTLVASPSDCNGSLTSGGYNLIQSTNGCTIAGSTTGNILNQDPRLGLLGDNGGTTLTHALLTGSPAIDAGNPATPGSGNGACTISDQRGVARPQPSGGRCDIGAVEFQGGGLSITLVVPSNGGNSGSALVMIQSNGGFLSAATSKLVRAGQADIPGSPVTVGVDGAMIMTSFDLTGKAPGPWDVVVTNPDGTSVTRAAGFTIETPQAPNLWSLIVGPTLVRIGIPATYTILFGNRGNAEAWGVPLSIGVSENVSFSFKSPITPPPGQTGQILTDWSQIPVTLPPDSGGIVYAELVLPFIPPGFTGAIQFTVLAPPGTHGEGVDMISGIFSPYYQPNLDPQHQVDLINFAELNTEVSLGVTFPSELVPALQQYLNTQLQDLVQQSRSAWVSSLGAQYQVYSDAQLQVDLMQFAVAQAQSGAMRGMTRATRFRKMQKYGGVEK
jgi:CSLREA domain-containing protein